MKCPICDKPIKIRHTLINTRKEVLGVYDSEECARKDSGARDWYSTPFTIRAGRKTIATLFDKSK
jgi:hypothetical protein